MIFFWILEEKATNIHGIEIKRASEPLQPMRLHETSTRSMRRFHLDFIHSTTQSSVILIYFLPLFLFSDPGSAAARQRGRRRIPLLLRRRQTGRSLPDGNSATEGRRSRPHLLHKWNHWQSQRRSHAAQELQVRSKLAAQAALIKELTCCTRTTI